MRSQLVAILLAVPLVAAAQPPADEAAILFLKIPTVQGASRFDQIASEAPASVSVITAEEISRHGWRTLGEIVSNVRGFFTTYDRTYTYVASRGFGRPGDFSNRLLLLLDGRAVNEIIYGGGAYGTESVVDVGDIERVEFIRGPGSSLYGASAFFGVVNVITRRGRDLEGGRARLTRGSYGTTAAEARYGSRLSPGVELLVSGQLYRQRGQEHFYPEFNDPSTHHGIARFDRDAREHLLLKLGLGDVTLEGVYNNRVKQVPTASYGTLFDDPAASSRDAEGLLSAGWNRAFPDGRRITVSAGYTFYDYRGGFPLEDGLYRDQSRGRWLGAEASLLHPLGRRYKLIVGSELRLNLLQEQTSGKAGAPPSFVNDTRNHLWAVYLQDEVRLGRLILNAGARYDHYATFGGTLNPRAALVYGWEGGAAKLLYGRAFRAPSNFELYYEDGYSTKAAPALGPERIVTTEGVVEDRLGRHLRGVLSVYEYRATGLITPVLDPGDGLIAYRNAERVRGRGVEAALELERASWQARASYALQRSVNLESGEELSNSPRHLAQLGVSRALRGDRLTAGFTLQAMSGRKTASGPSTAAFALGNFSLWARRIVGALGGGLGIYNLWNTRYSDPVGEEHVQAALRQDGRHFRLSLSAEL